MKSNINDVSKFVIDFIESTDKDKLKNKWESKDVQKDLKKILKKIKSNKVNAPIKKPKRCKSSYIYFCEDKRPEIKKENPTMDAKIIVTKLGKLWAELKKENNSSKLLQYEKCAKKDKQRYEKEMIEYNKMMQNYYKEYKVEILDKVEIVDKVEILDKVEIDDKKNKIKKSPNKKTVEKKLKIEDIIVDEKNDKGIHESIVEDKVVDEEDIDENFENYFVKKIKKFTKMYPALTSEQLMKKMKKKWNKLSEDKKSKY